jgi:drug/metabolite transporter (DMT)-like permease
MNNSKLRWVLLIGLALVWGSSFILMKRGLEGFTSNQVAALRMFIAFLAVTPFIYKHVRPEFGKHWKNFLAVGLFGNFIPAFLFTKAETGITSALTGMLNSLTPLFTLMFGVLFFGMKTNWKNRLGVFIGFIGAIGLLFANGVSSFGSNLSYGVLVIIATVCYAISVNLQRKNLNDVNAITITVWAFTFIGPFGGIYLLLDNDFHGRLAENPAAMPALLYVAILAVVGTAISVALFSRLIKISNALFASSVTYLIPIVAILWGIFEKETLTGLHFLFIGVILAGVYMVNKK